MSEWIWERVCVRVCVGRVKLISLFNNLVREVCWPAVTLKKKNASSSFLVCMRTGK